MVGFCLVTSSTYGVKMSEPTTQQINQQIETLIKDIGCIAHVAALAIALAREAGEEVKRPLSKDQLRRALRVLMDEHYELMPMLWDIAKQLVPPKAEITS